jgi:putative transcriptional regulator
MYHFTESGLDNIYLKNGFKVINTPEGEAVSIKDIDNLHNAIAQSIIHKDEPLLGKEFRLLRIEMDLSQKALGQLMEKSDQTIAIWEKGDEAVPALADKAIRDLYSESIGGGTIAGLLQRLSEVDRQLHEIKLEIELREQDNSWHVMPLAY